MTKNSYLHRLKEREQTAEIKREIAFGFVIGSILALVAGWEYFFVINAWDALWLAFFCVGIIIFLAGMAIPQILYWPEKIWMAASQHIGRLTFTILLSILYFLCVTPLGCAFRMIKGVGPFVRWTGETQPKNAEGWSEKRLDTQTLVANSGRKNIITQFFFVIVFFIRNKQWLMIPIVIILIILGIILFFVQSSVLAPFIYTIF